MSIETREGITDVHICNFTGNACTEQTWCQRYDGCAKRLADELHKAAHDPKPDTQ